MQKIPKDLSQHPKSMRAIKKPIPVEVIFAESDGVIRTLEGSVSYKTGDAILSGLKGESWPIQRVKFLANYRPVSDAQPGSPGAYVKKPLTVWALQLEAPYAVSIGSKAEPLQGRKGDWLVQYGEADFGIVNADIFKITYELLR